jgi:hypothetical protein
MKLLTVSLALCMAATFGVAAENCKDADVDNLGHADSAVRSKAAQNLGKGG